MKLSSVEGVHEFAHSRDDVTSLEISDSLFHFTNMIFHHLPGLRKIKVKASGLSTLEPPMESTSLLRLEIEGNNFNNVPSEVFAGLENLENLHLDSNHIQELLGDSFSGLLHLVELRLEDNEIKALPERVFDSLPNLKSLSLMKNLLSSLEGNLLIQNRLLTTLRFNDNRELRSINPSLLNSLTSLDNVDFRFTCVGRDIFDVETTIRMMKQNCRK